MRIGIYARLLKTSSAKDFFLHLTDLLDDRNIEMILYKPFGQHLMEEHDIELKWDLFDVDDLKTDTIDYLLSIGGDGTMLDTLGIVQDRKIPVIGVNLGRFGFLASSQTNEIEDMLDELVNKSYSIDRRSVLRLVSDDGHFEPFPYGLNDFVIHKRDSASMIIVHAYLNGEFLNSYWADGLIIATPTGSSGYSLSCGGPLCFPQSASFVITPIAPHNLNVRPVVISDENVVSFEFEARNQTVLASLDSRSESISTGQQLAIRKADFFFKMITLSNQNYMNTIRKKLNWGIDQRNY